MEVFVCTVLCRLHSWGGNVWKYFYIELTKARYPGKTILLFKGGSNKIVMIQHLYTHRKPLSLLSHFKTFPLRFCYFFFFSYVRSHNFVIFSALDPSVSTDPHQRLPSVAISLTYINLPAHQSTISPPSVPIPSGFCLANVDISIRSMWPIHCIQLSIFFVLRWPRVSTVYLKTPGYFLFRTHFSFTRP